MQTNTKCVLLLFGVQTNSSGTFSYHVYENVGHGFDSSPADQTETDARDDGRTRALDIFDEYLGTNATGCAPTPVPTPGKLVLFCCSFLLSLLPFSRLAMC